MESTCNRQWKKGWKCTRGLHETGPCALVPDGSTILERWRYFYENADAYGLQGWDVPGLLRRLIVELSCAEEAFHQ